MRNKQQMLEWTNKWRGRTLSAIKSAHRRKLKSMRSGMLEDDKSAMVILESTPTDDGFLRVSGIFDDTRVEKLLEMGAVQTTDAWLVGVEHEKKLRDYMDWVNRGEETREDEAIESMLLRDYTVSLDDPASPPRRLTLDKPVSKKRVGVCSMASPGKRARISTDYVNSSLSMTDLVIIVSTALVATAFWYLWRR